MPATAQLLLYYQINFGSLLEFGFSTTSLVSDDAQCDII